MFICEIWLFVWYFPQFCTSVEVRISRSVSVGPFDFAITRFDCTVIVKHLPGAPITRHGLIQLRRMDKSPVKKGYNSSVGIWKLLFVFAGRQNLVFQKV